MTDPELADRTYIEPITVESAERIIAAERPDAVLPTMGGQTALNLAVAAGETGILAKYGCELIGAQLDAIEKAEDRQRFKDCMQRIGIDVPNSGRARTRSTRRAGRATSSGFPAILRPCFTLGGTGRRHRLQPARSSRTMVARGARRQPHARGAHRGVGDRLEGVRAGGDARQADNVVIICSIENFDPMGVHTGDSITVAPAQTLTDKEYQRMRDAALRVIRAIGVETGGSNIQFGVNPQTAASWSSR